jgi:hypothetical protein
MPDRVLHSIVMAQPEQDALLLPEHLRSLVEQLASLSAGDREAVVRSARETAHGEAGPLPTASWDSIDAAKGVVHWGGNALEDAEALYDG